MTARMKGWQTRTFLEKPYLHHRPMGTATQHILQVNLKGGRTDYVLGNHPVWQLCRCLYQMTRRPFLLGGSLRLVGYMWAMVRRLEFQVPPDLVQFRRGEQMRRLTRFVTRGPGFESAAHDQGRRS
jgi:biofilm PGA synthesis N-glycosyltransferase PgaC